MGPWAVTVTHKKQDVPHKDADIVLLSSSGVYTVTILWRRKERYKGSMDWVLACRVKHTCEYWVHALSPGIKATIKATLSRTGWKCPNNFMISKDKYKKGQWVIVSYAPALSLTVAQLKKFAHGCILWIYRLNWNLVLVRWFLTELCFLNFVKTWETLSFRILTFDEMHI